VKDAIAFIESHFGTRYAIGVGVVILVYSALVGCAKLLEVWRALKTRKAYLEELKIQAEILKLQAETEKVRKEAGLEALPASIAWLGQQSASHLPRVPEFSLEVVLSYLVPSLAKPPPGIRSALWSMHWIVVLVVVLWLSVLGIARVFPHDIAVVPAGILALIFALTLVYHAVRAVYHASIAAVAAYMVRKQAARDA
jgi:uncharacterized membrane-anchored protein